MTNREFTGVGFFTNLAPPTDAPRAELSGQLVLGNVAAEIEGLDHGAGFILFVQDGYLDFLEGFSYDEPWPDRIGSFTLSPIGTLGAESNPERVQRAWATSQAGGAPPPSRP